MRGADRHAPDIGEPDRAGGHDFGGRPLKIGPDLPALVAIEPADPGNAIEGPSHIVEKLPQLDIPGIVGGRMPVELSLEPAHRLDGLFDLRGPVVGVDGVLRRQEADQDQRSKGEFSRLASRFVDRKRHDANRVKGFPGGSEFLTLD